MIQDGPLAYWRLDETVTAVFHDSSGNGWDTNIFPNNYRLNQTGLVPTSSDASVLVGNVTSSMNTSRQVTFVGTSLTIEAWINTLAAAAQNHIVLENNGTSNLLQRAQFRLNSGNLQMLLFDSSNVLHTASAAGLQNDGRTHHVVGTFDGTTMTLYVDGAVSGTPVVGAFTGKTGVWTVGLGYPINGLSGSNLGGYLDEVAIYEFALTAAQVAKHYQLGTSLS